MRNISSSISSTTPKSIVKQAHCSGSQGITKVPLSLDVLVSTKSPHFHIPITPKSSPSFMAPLVPLVQSHTSHQVPIPSLFIEAAVCSVSTLSPPSPPTLHQATEIMRCSRRFLLAVGPTVWRASTSTTKDNC